MGEADLHGDGSELRRAMRRREQLIDHVRRQSIRTRREEAQVWHARLPHQPLRLINELLADLDTENVQLGPCGSQVGAEVAFATADVHVKRKRAGERSSHE